MKYRLPLAGAALLFAAILTAQEPAADGPEVLTRGPIHEAYAAAINAQPQPGAIVPKAPPELIEELPPDQKPEGEDVQWIPGYWAWDEDRNDYIWVSGFWRQPPPGRQWVPGTWRQVGVSWQWTSGYWGNANERQAEYVPQPPAPPDIGPATPAPGDNYTYVPGTWVYRETRFAWRPGFWCAHRPDWVFIPAHYVWTPYGYVFVDGYWDFPLRRRGVLFAPVHFGRFYRPALVYRPAFVVYDDAIFGALFVRRGCSAYYFGDYFDPRFRTAGFSSWIDVRIGTGCYDPLWGYYRHAHAGNPGWVVGINNLYVGRFRGDIARPPVNFRQQNIVVNNIQKNTTIVNNNTTVINNVSNVTMVAPITNVDKSVVKLRPTTKDEQTAAVASAREVRQAAVQRVKLEQQAFAESKPATPTRPGQPVPARAIRVEVPKTGIVNTKPVVAPPPPPAPGPSNPDAGKDRPKAGEPKTKAPDRVPDQPKTKGPDAPKGQPKSEQPKTNNPDMAKDKDRPKSEKPAEQPKAPDTPRDRPKMDRPKTTTPEQPKATTPPPLPGKPPEQPKATTPPPLPSKPPEQPKATTPPPLPSKPPEQPKATTPPPLPSKPPEQPKAKAPEPPRERPKMDRPAEQPKAPPQPSKPPVQQQPTPTPPRPPVQQQPTTPAPRPPVQQQPPAPAPKPPVQQQPPPAQRPPVQQQPPVQRPPQQQSPPVQRPPQQVVPPQRPPQQPPPMQRPPKPPPQQQRPGPPQNQKPNEKPQRPGDKKEKTRD